MPCQTIDDDATDWAALESERDQFLLKHRRCNAALDAAIASISTDPRAPHPTREGRFRLHNCSRCGDGARPCKRGNPNQCEFPHARND